MDPSSSPSDSSHNPGLTRGTWAKRTGFKSNLSGESISDTESKDLEMGSKGMATQTKVSEPPDLIGNPHPNTKREQNGKEKMEKPPESLLKPPTAPHQVPSPRSSGKGVKTEGNNKNTSIGYTNNHGSNNNTDNDTSNIVENSNGRPAIRIEPIKRVKDSSDVDATSLSQDSDDDHLAKHSHIKYEIRETPRYGMYVYIHVCMYLRHMQVGI